MIVRTDAVVLRAFDYGETSRIATVLTRRHGVIGLLAKGARRPRSRYGAALRAGAHLEVVYYFREGRGLQTLTEASHIARFPGIAEDLERLTLAHRLLEIVRSLLPEGDSQPIVLALLIHALGWLDEPAGAGAQPGNAVPWFQLRLSSCLGFAPDLRREDVMALEAEGGHFRLDTGHVGPRGSEAPAGRLASRAALRALAVLARADLPVAGRMVLEPTVRDEVDDLVDAFMQYHAESALPARVRKVAGQIEEGLAAAREGLADSAGAEEPAS